MITGVSQYGTSFATADTPFTYNLAITPLLELHCWRFTGNISQHTGIARVRNKLFGTTTWLRTNLAVPVL